MHGIIESGGLKSPRLNFNISGDTISNQILSNGGLQLGDKNSSTIYQYVLNTAQKRITKQEYNGSTIKSITINCDSISSDYNFINIFRRTIFIFGTNTSRKNCYFEFD